MKTISLFMMVAGMLMMTAGCSEEIAVENTPPHAVNDGEGVVRLALGGAAGSATKTRAEETTIEAESDEKTVESLYAVVFKDAVVSNEDGEDNSTDLFFKVITPEVSDESNELVREFSVGTGDYQICFVANPSEDLLSEIKGLTAGSSSVEDFKKLVETKSPDTKPCMLMTSSFYKAAVTSGEATDLETVTLERAMARIDIVNKADGITINSVTLKNRATESVLISDAATTENAAFKDTTYTDMNLAGSSDGSVAYKAKIYSYEQFGEGGYAPSMEVSYSIGENNYTHTIAFVTKGEDDAETQINLKRNNLYTVNITNNAGKLTFTLSVADWNEGATFEVTSSELLDGTDPYKDAALGDVLLSDGTLVKQDAITDEQKSEVIGIVAYLYAEGDTRAKAKTDAHGLVLALKNAGEVLAWSSSKTAFGTAYSTFKDAYNNGSDGLTLTDAIINSTTTLSTSFPAFNAVKTFRENTPAPTTIATDWYIPSIGEWIDILGTDGLGGADISSVKSSSSNDLRLAVMSTIINNLDGAMKNVGASYDSFNNINTYWSSTESSAENAYNITINDSNSSKTHFYGGAKNGASYRLIRCILTF